MTWMQISGKEASLEMQDTSATWYILKIASLQ